MQKLLTLVFLLIGWMASAQNGAPPVAGARGAAMGNAAVTFTDIYSAFSNQAGLGLLEQSAIAVTGEQRFLLNEIRSISAAAAYPTTSGTIALTANYFGFDDFNEQRFGLAYGRKLFDQLSIGAQFVALNTRIPEYGNNTVFTFEIGVLSEILPDLTLGAHIYSPVRIELVPDEDLPAIFNLGLAYHPSEKVTLNAQVEKADEYPARVRAGVEYQLIDPLYLRVGIVTDPSVFSFGLGLQLDNGLAIDVASSYQQLLGFTPTVSLIYAFGSKTETTGF